MINQLKRNSKLYTWWKPKAGFLLSLLFFSYFLGNASVNNFIKTLFLSIITLSAIGVFGHLLNDWGDKEVDKLANKKNIFENKTFLNFGLLSGFTLFIAILPWWFLPTTQFCYILLFTEFFLFYIYALKPFRLKRHPKVAIVIDALYAYAIPSVLAFYTYSLAFNVPNIFWLHYVLLFVWAFSIGLRHIIYHQVEDADNDKKSGISNIALVHSSFYLSKFIRKAVVPVEFLSSFLFILTLYIHAPFISALSIIILVLSFGTFRFKLRFSNHNFNHYTIDSFYQFYWMGLILTAINTKLWFNPFFIIVFVICLLVFSNFINGNVYNSIIYIVRLIYKKIYQLGSTVINYSIYYYRKLFLKWDEQKNRGIFYKEWLNEKNGIIAVFNENLSKYTETFVDGHLKNLPFKIHLYYGQDLLNHNKEGNLISNNLLLKKLKLFLYSLTDFDLNNLLVSNLQSKNCQVLLSEFGTTGIKVDKISRATGIPHICIFQGYDAWHKDVLKQNNYTELFQNAAQIIGVSKDICQQLINLGCPKEKITYLPAYVNLELFKPKAFIQSEPIFLSVGRFAETKSPHLTILAFNEVLKEIPNAQLRMIGKDGGGELFEACHILVKALKIEDKVHFLGIKSPEEVYKEMCNARVFVQHSLTTPLNGDKEGTPVSIMEAMATGLPIVATKHAGIAELIDNGKNGILVEEFDYLAMAKEMIRVCNSDELVVQIGKEAAKTIQNNQLIQNHIQALTKIIQKQMIY